MIVLLVALAAVLTGAVDAEIPLEFTSAVNSGEPRDILSISNYGAGASMTEAYTDIDQLSRETQVSTRSYGPGPASPAGGLEASISSQVIGRAHISW
ncbi:MAG: hypothetical protein QUS08_08700, partial [Methanothrix sp.]|nr:hypothetical protein [Methanothrix sp.]